jgi:hypothetical protein
LALTVKGIPKTAETVAYNHTLGDTRVLQFNPQLVIKNQFGEQSQNVSLAGTQGFPLLSAAVVLTAAQVIALNATPITVIPAVSGKLIVVMAMELSYKKGSAAFTIGSSKHLQAQYASAGLIGQVAETGFIDQASNTEGDIIPGGSGFIGARGQAVQVTSDDTTITVGTGSTVTVQALYFLI